MQFPSSFFTTLIGLQIQIQSNGAILFYSGTPATGNLVISIAGASGTDPYGNNYPAGFAAFDGSENLLINITSSGITIQNDGADGQWTFSRQGLSLTYVMAVTHLASLLMQYEDSLNVFHTYASLGPAGFNVNAGSMLAVDPSTGNTGTPAIPETWHNPSMGSGWALGDTSGTIQALQYRLEPDQSVWLFGSIHTINTTPAANLFTLPANYFLSGKSQRIQLASQLSTTMTEDFATIDGSGNVTLITNPTTANVNFHFDTHIRTV